MNDGVNGGYGNEFNSVVGFLVSLLATAGAILFGLFLGEIVKELIELARPAVGPVLAWCYGWIVAHYLLFTGAGGLLLIFVSYVIYRWKLKR